MTLIIAGKALRAIRTAKAARTPAETLRFGLADCGLGKVLVARSAKGVCAILLGEETKALAADLATRFPAATLVPDDAAVTADIARVLAYVEQPSRGLSLTLDMRGTPFQRRVWEKLRAIPAGRTVSYRELAGWVGPLTSPRAVGAACAANPIALAVPCHRVVRTDCTLAGYRWGIERKRDLITREASA